MIPVYLIGGRGSGKSTVARYLGKRHSWWAADLDMVICERLGKTVAEIVTESGWPGFRASESEFLLKLTEEASQGELPAVIACGGGIVEDEENISLMRERGFVIWLAPGVEAQVARLARDPLVASRPSLTGADILSELAEVMQRRDPLYRKAAHATLDSAMPLEEVCEAVKRLHAQNRQNRH